MKSRLAQALEHKNTLGAGASKRRSLLHGKEKIPVVMREFKRGTLHSGSGRIVTKRPQALAIALSEAGLSNRGKNG